MGPLGAVPSRLARAAARVLRSAGTSQHLWLVPRAFVRLASMRFRCVCVLCVSHSDALHRNDEAIHSPPYEPTPPSSTGKARSGTNDREEDPTEPGVERRKVQRNAALEVQGGRRRGRTGNEQRSSARDGPFEASGKFEELFFRAV